MSDPVARYEVQFTADTTEVDKGVARVSDSLSRAAQTASGGKGLAGALSNIFAGVAQGLQAGIKDSQEFAKANGITISSVGQCKLALAGLAAGLAVTVASHLSAKRATEEHAAALGRLAEGHSGIKGRLEELGRAFEGVGRNVEASGQSMGFWGTAVASTIAFEADRAIMWLKGMGQAALGTVTEFEKTRATMASLIGKEWVDSGKFENMSAAMGDAKEAAKELLAWTQKLAIESPFEEKDVTATLRIAQAYGFAATQYRTVAEAQAAGVITAQRLTEATLNWAAATGRGGDAMQTVAFVSGQISKTGRLMGQDMMQLANVGISLEAAIAKSMGKSTSEIAQMREKGLIPSTVAMKALIEELETYGASAKEQSNTLGGLLASISDLQKVASRSLATPFFDNFREGLANLIAILQSDDFISALANIGQKAGETFKGAAVAMAVFGDALKGTVVALGEGDFGGILDVLQGALTRNIPVLDEAFKTVQASILGLGDASHQAAPAIESGLQEARQAVDEILVSGLDGAGQAVADSLAQVGEGGHKLAEGVEAAHQSLTPLQVAAQAVASAVAYVRVAIEGFLEGLKVGQERFGPLLAGLGGLGAEAAHLVSLLTPTKDSLLAVSTAAGTLAALLYGALAGALQLVGKYWESLVIHFGAGVVIQAVVAILGTLAVTLMELLAPMELVGAAVALFIEAWINDWGGVRDITLVVVGVVASVLGLLGEVISAAIPYVVGLAQVVGGILVSALQVAGQVILWVAEHFKLILTVVGAVAAAIGGVGLVGAISLAVSIFQGLIAVVASAGGVLGAISTVFGIVAAAVNLPIIAIGLLIAAVVGLVLAWQQNLGNIQEHTHQVFGGIALAIQTLGQDIGSFGSALKTAITQGPSAAFEQFQADLVAHRANYSAQMDQLAADTEASMQRNAGAVQGFAAENADAQGGIQGAALKTGEIMKAVMSGDLEEAKRLASGALGGISGVFGNAFAGIRADAWNTAAQVQAAMALARNTFASGAKNLRPGGLAAEAQEQTQTWGDLEQKAMLAEDAAWAAGRHFGNTGNAYNQGAAQALGKGAGGGGKKAAETVAEQIKEAAEVIRSVTDTVLKLKDFLASGPLASLRSDAKSEEIIQVAVWIIDLGKRMSAVFLEAAKGFKEEGNKAAAALAEAIGSATKSVGDVAGLLIKLGDLMKHEKWPDMHANMDAVLAIAQELLAFGMALAAVLIPAAEGLKEEAAKSASYLAQAIQSAAQAVTAVVELLPKLWAFVESPDFDDIMAARAKLLEVAKKLIAWGKSLGDVFIKAAKGVSEQQAKAAQSLSSIIGSATGSVSQILELIPKLLLFMSDPGFMAALNNPAERSALLKVAKALIKFGAEVGKLFADAGKGLKEKLVVQAKRLADIIGSASQGLTATEAALRLLLSVASQRDLMTVLESKAAQEPLRAVTRYLARLARIIGEDWAAEGRKLSSITVAAAQRLTEGVKATGDGLSAAYSALMLLASQAPTVNRIAAEGERYLAWLVALTGWLARLSLYLIREWGKVGAELSSLTGAAAQRLTEGVKATSDGLGAAFGALMLMASQAPTIQRIVTEGEPYFDWLVGLTGWLARLAAYLSNEWGRVASLLNQTGVSNGQALTAAIKNLVDGLGAALSALMLLASQASTISRVASWGDAYYGYLLALVEWLAHLAAFLADEWNHVAVLLKQETTGQGQALTAAVKAVGEGLSATLSAVLFLVSQGPTISAIARQGLPLIDYLVALTTWLAHVASYIANEWGRVAVLLNQTAQGPIDALTQAIQSTADGLGSTLAAIELLLEQRVRVDTLARQGQPLIDYLKSLTDWLAALAVGLANEWGYIALWLNPGVTTTAAALTDAIKATAEGLASVMSAVTLLLQSRRTVDSLASQGQALIDYLRGLTGWLGALAALLSNDWGYAALALDQAMTGAGAKLSDAVKGVADGLGGVVAAIDLLLQQRRLIDSLSRQGQPLIDYLRSLTGWLADLAVALSGEWGRAASRLDALLPDGAALTAAIKAVTEGLASTVEAVQFLVDLTKRGFPTIDPEGAYELVILPLVNMAKALADKMALAIAMWVPMPAATQALHDALAAGIEALLVTVQIVQVLGDLSKKGFPTIDPEGAYLLVIKPLVDMAKSLADYIALAVGAWVPIPAQTSALASVLKDGLDVLESVTKLVAYLTEKPKLPTLDDALKDWLTQAIKWAGTVATTCQAAAVEFIKLQTYGLGDLATVIKDGLEVLDSVRDAVKYLAERPELPTLTDALKQWITDAVKWAGTVATTAQAAAVEFIKLQTYGLGNLAEVMGDTMGVLDSVREAAKYLAERPDLPNLTDAAGGESLLAWVDRAVRWARDLAGAAIEAAKAFALAKDYGLGDLATGIGDTMGVLDSVREAAKYLVERPDLPDLTATTGGESLLAWVGRAVKWARDLAGAAIDAAKEFVLAKDYGLGDLATGMGDTTGVLDSVRDAAKYLVERPDLPDLTATTGGESLLAWVGRAVKWARDLAGAAIDAAKEFALAKDYGLGDLATGIGDALGVLDSVRDAAKYLTEKPDLPVLTDTLKRWITDAVKWARDLTGAAIDGAKEFALAKDYGLGDLATGIGDALGVLDSVRDAAKYLAELPTLPPLDDTLKGWITDAVKWARGLAEAAIAGAKEFALAKDYGLGALSTAIGDALSVLDGVRDAVKYLAEKPELPDLTFALLVWIWRAVEWAGVVAETAANAARGFALAKEYGLGSLGTAIGDMLSVLDGVRDAVKYLAEKPDLPALTFALLVWIWKAVEWAGVVAETAANAARGFALAKEYGLGDLGTAMGDMMSVLKDVKDAADYLTKKPDLPALTDDVLDWIEDAVKWAQTVSEHALAAAGDFALAKEYGLGDLATAIGDALSVIKDTLDLAGMRSKLAAYRTLDTAALDSQLDQIVEDAKSVALRFLAKVDEAGIGEEWAKAASDFSGVVGDAVGAVKDVLDLTEQIYNPQKTYIPSHQQMERELGAVLDLVLQVATRFADKVKALPQEVKDQAKEAGEAFGEVFSGLKSMVELVQAFTGINLGMSGFNNIRESLRILFDIFDWAAERSDGLENTVSLISTLVNALESILGFDEGASTTSLSTLAAQSGADAGTAWVTGFVGELDASAVLVGQALEAVAATWAEGMSGEGAPGREAGAGNKAGMAWASGFISGVFSQGKSLVAAVAFLVDDLTTMMHAGAGYADYNYGDKAGAAWATGFQVGALGKTGEIVVAVITMMSSLTASAGLAGADAGAAWVAAFQVALDGAKFALPGVSLPGEIGSRAATGSGPAQAQTNIIQTRNQRNTNISMTNQNADAARQSMANLYAIVNF